MSLNLLTGDDAACKYSKVSLPPFRHPWSLRQAQGTGV